MNNLFSYISKCTTGMKVRFEEIIVKMERELLILDKLKSFRNPTDENSLRKFAIYSNLFNKNIANIKDSLDQL